MNKFAQLSRLAMLLSVFLLLPACQIIPEQSKKTESYGEYYLKLQQLNEQQLAEEVIKQQVNISSQNKNVTDKTPVTNTEITTKSTTRQTYDPQIKLLILYSLPASPIYNSFNAKALLNQMKSEDNNAAFTNISPDEQAFISMLDEQLNQRLLMRNRLLAQQQDQMKLALKQQQQLLEQVRLLEQTIKQLKNIEQAIDNRDQ
jgi:hypothetical protein